jgi:NADH:ubiquinone oxidoreductase subunit 6 (subunit J)
MALIVFYTLVIYTDVKISKQHSHTNRYKIEGIVSGLLFLIIVPVLLAYYIVQDHGFIGAWNHSPLLFTCYVLVALGILFLTVYVFVSATKAEHLEKTKNTEVQKEH